MFFTKPIDNVNETVLSLYNELTDITSTKYKKYFHYAGIDFVYITDQIAKIKNRINKIDNCGSNYIITRDNDNRLYIFAENWESILNAIVSTPKLIPNNVQLDILKNEIDSIIQTEKLNIDTIKKEFKNIAISNNSLTLFNLDISEPCLSFRHWRESPYRWF